MERRRRARGRQRWAGLRWHPQQWVGPGRRSGGHCCASSIPLEEGRPSCRLIRRNLGQGTSPPGRARSHRQGRHNTRRCSGPCVMLESSRVGRTQHQVTALHEAPRLHSRPAIRHLRSSHHFYHSPSCRVHVNLEAEAARLRSPSCRSACHPLSSLGGLQQSCGRLVHRSLYLYISRHTWSC